ncbi:hypothetical protein K2173_020733 [Erythroxylum novogranatense]|uniref:RNase H type-1 domain-containing protein n=1 Tax=Erythroxylum novogranatense TaxID=1862640 RepID=A0AAV8TPN0_9ROSI|nr:hypothetical protein K2173_020733 [Erythroxylum novogranatense]
MAARQVVLPTAESSPLKWMLPPEGTLKLNANSMFQHNSGVTGAGWILRDHLGCRVGGGMCNSGMAANPVLAEAIGLREALSWLKGAFTNSLVDVEVDCLELVVAIQGKHYGSYLGGIVSDINSLLDQFQSIAISHVKRSANQVAHRLALASGSLSGSHWLDFVPPAFISNVMLLDLV